MTEARLDRASEISVFDWRGLTGFEVIDDFIKSSKSCFCATCCCSMSEMRERFITRINLFASIILTSTAQIAALCISSVAFHLTITVNRNVCALSLSKMVSNNRVFQRAAPSNCCVTMKTSKYLK